MCREDAIARAVGGSILLQELHTLGRGPILGRYAPARRVPATKLSPEAQVKRENREQQHSRSLALSREQPDRKRANRGEYDRHKQLRCAKQRHRSVASKTKLRRTKHSYNEAT